MKSYLMAEVKAVDSSDPNGEFEVILSAPTLDRDGEIVDSKAFEPLPEHITFDIDHAMSVEKTVGSGVPRYDGEQLKVRGTYASTPLGQMVRSLVKEKHIRSTSVAFMDAVREVDEKDGKPHIRRAELLNGAFVPIPSNRDSLVLAAKAYAEKVGARNSAADAERIQSGHDLLVDLGAVCEGVAKSKDTKAVVGSHEERAERLREALRGQNPDAEWLWTRATFDDEVVYEVEDEDHTVTTYRVTYTIEGDSFAFGAPEEVDLAEVITPPVKSKKSTTTDPEDAAAPAAAPPADVNVALAQALAAEAEVAQLT